MTEDHPAGHHPGVEEKKTVLAAAKDAKLDVPSPGHPVDHHLEVEERRGLLVEVDEKMKTKDPNRRRRLFRKRTGIVNSIKRDLLISAKNAKVMNDPDLPQRYSLMNPKGKRIVNVVGRGRDPALLQR